MSQFSLRKLMLPTAMALGFGLTSLAQEIPAGYVEVPDYVEHFSSQSVASFRFNGPTDPLGWSSLTGDINNCKISYTATTPGKEGYCIYTSSSWNQTDYSNNSTPVEIFDYIITPLVKGELKFFIKKYSTSSYYTPGLEFYRMHKDASGNFSCDPATDRIIEYDHDLATELPNASTWFEHSLNVGDEYCYIGIRMQCLYFDEFSASSAILPINKVITLGSVTMKDGYSTKVKTSSEGKISVGYTINVTNSGNVPLAASAEGENYSLTLSRAISTSSPYTYEEIARFTIPDLAVGETQTMDLVSDVVVPDNLTPGSTGEVRFRVDVINNYDPNEDVSKRLKTGQWFDITPYEAIMTIQYNKYSSKTASSPETVEPDKYLNYGTFQGEKGKEFSITNKGAIDLVITSVDKPEWITIEDFQLPFTLVPDETKKINVIIGGEKGVKQGTVKFNFEGMALADRIPVKAEVVDENEYFVNFESEESLIGWYLPSGTNSWKIADYSSSERNANDSFFQLSYNVNDSRLENGNNNAEAQYIYTPKLVFAEGDPIAFYAAKRTNNGNDVRLEISYSTDRSNWTDMGKITVTNDNTDYQFSSGVSTSPTTYGSNVLKRFEFEMPEGEYYIRFGAGYVLLDDFHGGSLAEVDYDMVSESLTMGKAKMVNVPVTATASFKNLNMEALAADVQTVTLYANGEAVATAEPVEIGAGETVNYEFTYIPHEAGEVTYLAEIAIEDYKCVSPEAKLTIVPEASEVESQIGEIKTSEGSIPIYLGYNNSKSETVYKADLLSGIGGTTITSLTYKYYRTGNSNTSERLRIWLANSDDTNMPTKIEEFTDVNTMELVYDVEGYEFLKVGSSGDYYDLEFVLDTPFEYEPGKNLRVVIENLGTNYVSSNFAVDNTSGIGNTYYFASDNRDSFLAGTGWTYGTKNMIPVMVIKTSKDISPISGTVKTANGTSIEGAKVVARANDTDVYYETVTDTDGNWEMTIYQTELDYTISATAVGFNPSEPVALDWDNSVSINIVLDEEIIVHPVNGTYTVSQTENEDFYDVDITWAMGDDNESEEFNGYVFDIVVNDIHHGTTTKTSYKLENLEKGEYIVAITGTTPTGSKTNTHVINVNLVNVGVDGVESDSGEWRYFDLNGIEVKADRLGKGIYIRTNGNKTMKVIVNK